MKARRKNVLLSLLFFLAVACSPEPPTLTNFYNSGHPYKTNARKQQPPTGHPENSGKETSKNATQTSGKTAVANSAIVPKKSDHYQPIETNPSEVPEMLASASNEIPWFAFRSGNQTYFNAFPPRTPAIKPPFKTATSAQTEAIKTVAKSKETQLASIQQKSAKEQDTSSGFLFGLSGILSVGLLGANLKRFRKLSEWASQNRAKSRLLLLSTRIFTAVSAVVAGNYLADQGMLVSEFAKEIALSVCTAAAVLYPVRNSKFQLFKSNYFRQKLLDIALFSSGTFLMFSAANHYDFTTKPAAPEQTIFSTATFSPQTAGISLVKNTNDFRPDNPDDPKPDKNKSVGAKVALTILFAAIFVGLTMLLAALACNIACAGYGALAFLVFFAGEAGAIVLLVMALKRVFGKKKKAPETENNLSR